MKFLTFISVCLAIAALGVLTARYGGGFRLSAAPPSPLPVPTEGQGLGDVGPVVRFEPFVMSEVNNDGQHMNTVTFEVEVSDAQGRDILKSRTSEIRSAILTILADTKLSDIGVPEDFTNLKKKVQSRIEEIVPDQVVRRVLITEFLSI
jgi:flagellar basal body-associated protein FliL